MLRTPAAGAPVQALVLLILLPALSLGVSTSFWEIDSFEDWSAGSPSGVTVTNDGSLTLGPALETLSLDEAQYIWSAREGSDGRVYAVAGTPGRLYAFDGGDPTVLAEDESADYPALAVSPEGEVYVGTAPGGVVYRLDRDGMFEELFDTRQGYVWSMAYSNEHGLVVGTGDSARVFVVDDRGDARTVYSSSEASVTSIACFDGRIVIGTAPDGLLLDVTPGEDTRALFDSHYEEIPGIARDRDGRVLFAGTTVSFDDALSPGDEFGQNFGDGSVYALTDAGGAVEIWYSGDSPVSALGPGPGGDTWVGTGHRGRVYSVDAYGNVDVVTELPDDQVLYIGGGGEGVLVTTGMGAAVHRVTAARAGEGVYESESLDAGAGAFWGELSWKADTPGDASVVLRTRSGNTAVPGDSWSEWSTVVGEGEGKIVSPPARFLQWRAELEGGGDVPVLRRVSVAYTTENLPPRVGPVMVHERGAPSSAGSAAGSVTQTLPSGVDVTYSLSARGSEGAGAPAITRGLRTVEWDAMDPNGDRLEFELWIRSEDEVDWKLLEGPVERSVHTWDSTTMPDGMYRMRVVGFDRPSNPPGSSLDGEAESDPFVVDNGAPEFDGLSVERAGGQLTVTGRASDRWTQLSTVEVALDYGEWAPAYADDGSYDSTEETFTAELEVDGSGELAVSVRVIDRAGNVAVERRVLR